MTEYIWVRGREQDLKDFKWMVMGGYFITLLNCFVYFGVM